MNFLKDILDFFLPSHCSICKKKLSHKEKVVCDECLYSIPVVVKPFCERCGRPTEGESVCNECIEHPHEFSRARAIGKYDSALGELVKLFKYARKISIGKKLGYMLSVILQGDEFLSRGDVLIPVPLHPVAERRRGYNQSEILASEISKFTEIPVLNKVLYKIKPTKSQTEAEDRQLNVKDAFKVKGDKEIRGKKIILIDDVCTTGATLDECAKELHKATASDVYALVCARAA